MPQTKTYALVLESQGFKKEALEIYKKLIKSNPKDTELKENIKRLQTRKKFEGVNILKLEEFNKITKENRYDFENYLKDFKWI